MTVSKKQKTAVSTGKIVPVPGGHIVRSTGRKDRHSKVCTAKGLRDRRVRLSAHTAIEFYDVQDRLGYDRPSMAVDWLMKNAKAAIDELDELPPWLPTADAAAAAAAAAATTGTVQEVVLASAAEAQPAAAANSMNSKSDAAIAMESFFPMAAASSSYPPDLLSRTSSHVQDLRLSLESTSPNLFSFDTGSSVPLNIAETAAGGSGSIGSWWQHQQQQQQSVIDHQFFTQRGPLQSSASPSVPSWMDSMASAIDHNNMHPSAFHHPSSVPGFEYGPGGSAGSFSGFRMPSWIQGEVDEHGGGSTASRKPSSSHQ